jgi:hypothetical protein
MYEIWSIRPATLAYQFETLTEVNEWVEQLTEQYGAQAINNHALFSGVTFENQGNFVAQDEDIVRAVKSLIQMQDLFVQISQAMPQLQSSTQEIMDAIANGLGAYEATASNDWMNGFLAAAVHGFRIDPGFESFSSMTPLDQPVRVESSLKPTG